jgi:trehalose 6-phosphate synthase
VTQRTGFVVVANRLPVHRVRRGEVDRWRTSPGGLVSALTPILRQRSGIWAGWSGVPGNAPAPFTHDDIRNMPIALDEADIRAFYEGFCNRTLWPLYHDALRRPRFRRDWWDAYVRINRRFADAVAGAADDGATVWVHDYQLQLVPAFLRDQRPDLRIGFFLHIPFPPVELFARLPWRRSILEGMLGADLVGFQNRQAAENFAALCRRYCGSVGRHSLRHHDREVMTGAFPISIDVAAFEALSNRADVQRRAAEVRERVGARHILLGVDRLDYTKGIDVRLRAFGEMLRNRPGETVDSAFIQVAVPSRERVAEYRDMRSRIERVVGEINGHFGAIGRPVVHYMRRNYPPAELVALYRAADVMVVTPFRDGMNLVAKEYVASRIEGTGILLLSEFTGAAFEFQSSLLVNPYDVDGLARSMQHALDMSDSEQRQRMNDLRETLHNNTVFDWAGSFLEQLAG